MKKHKRPAKKSRKKRPAGPVKLPWKRWRRMEQSVLMASAAGWIRILMERRKVGRAELARRIGRSKPYITQLLRAPSNLTLRTLADVAWALHARFTLHVAVPFAERVKIKPRPRRKRRRR
jgi:hypothetical protein